MLFELEDPAFCTRYSGSLEVTGSVDETGHFTYYTTEEASFGLDCLTVTAVVAAPEFGACETSAENDIRFIELTAESLDGTELVLLTLSHQLPDGSEDLIYSRSQPISGQNYKVELDLHDLAEGRQPFIARISNGEGKQAISLINVVVDRTPPALTLTYPQPDARLCGISREVDGESRTVLDFEGNIEDQGGFFYQVEIETPATSGFIPLNFKRGNQPGGPSLPLCYGEGHNNKSQDALFATEGRHGEPYPGNQCNEILGPLTTYGDAPDASEPKFTGPAIARLHVYDRGGFHACTDVAFTYDGEVEGATVTPVNELFSPNDDGRTDELEIIVSSTEPTVIDSAEYATVNGSDNRRKIDGPILREMRNNLKLLTE
jgi:hypothetical protein